MNKFNCGDLVKIVGMVRKIEEFGHGSGIFYYDIDLEGSMPNLPQSCYLHEKALREFDNNDKEFFETRSKSADKRGEK